MAATDARPVCRKGVAWRLYFALRTSAGALYTSWAAQDSEVSLDGASFADCTNEATEIGTSGCGYLDLTSSETNADCIVIKIATTGGLTAVFTVFPEEAGDYRADVTHWSGTAVATPDTAGYPKVTHKSGTGAGELNLSSGRVESNLVYIGGAALDTAAAQLGVNVVNMGGAAGTFSGGRPEVNTSHWGGTAIASAVVNANTTQWGSVAVASANVLIDGAITAAKIAADAITDANVAADVTVNANLNAQNLANIADTVWEDIATDHTTTGTLGAVVQAAATSTGMTSAFTEIKGAGWLSTTDTLEKIRDASGGGGGSTVQINPIAISTGGPAEAPLMTCHQGEYGNKAFLFYNLDAYGQRSATDFSSYSHLRLGVALPTGTAWIETADITVSSNQLTFPIGSLTGDVGTFEATVWDWVGAGATDQRLVVACAQFVVTEAVGADEVTA